MKLHLNARLIMNELIKINFIIMNTKGSNVDWLNCGPQAPPMTIHILLVNCLLEIRHLMEPFPDNSVSHVGEISSGTSHLGINFLATLAIPRGGLQLMNC